MALRGGPGGPGAAAVRRVARVWPRTLHVARARCEEAGGQEGCSLLKRCDQGVKRPGAAARYCRSAARPLGAQVRPVDVATLAEERARAALQTELSLFEADRTVRAGPGGRAGAGGARARTYAGCVHPPAAPLDQ